MRDDRRGFALVAVLWALVLAAALAADLHAGARGDRRGAIAARAEARARWAARGGLAHAQDALRATLGSQSANGTLPPMDTLVVPAEELDFDGVAVRVTVVDARARLQLNLAGAGELRMLFAAAGLPSEQAYALAAEVVRWRVEHGPRVEARATDTLAALLRPPPGAFRSVAGLRAVPGATAAVYAAVAPYLTVASDGRVNLNTAPRAVLLTLPGFDDGAVGAVVARRRAAPFLTPYEIAAALPPGPRERVQDRMGELIARLAFTPREAEVRVAAGRPGEAVRATLTAVAVLAGGRQAPLSEVVER
jgi:type II secretory pathway component PulK